MDSREEACQYDAMDHSDVNHRFVEDLLATGAVRDEVLDLGTGTARIPIELCRRHGHVKTRAVDLAESMLDVARGNIARAGLAQRIDVDCVDAKNLPFADGRFACVMSNSIVHHIARPGDVLVEAVRVTAPGGLIFFRDLLRPGTTAKLAELVDTYAADANRHQRQMFRASLRAALTLAEIRCLVRELDFPEESVLPTSDRHWTWVGWKGGKPS
jgi:ubiquinone/menaquinone biosynthesis C-methylase UbiE